MHALDELNGKINTLVKKYTALETENKRLKDTIAKQTKTEQVLTKRLASLEQNMTGVDFNKSVGNDEEKDNMRRQLDNLITEIDSILNTLND